MHLFIMQPWFWFSPRLASWNKPQPHAANCMHILHYSLYREPIQYPILAHTIAYTYISKKYLPNTLGSLGSPSPADVFAVTCKAI